MKKQNTLSVENAQEQPPTQSEIDIAIIHAFESGYIQGHNDTLNGAFNNQTHFVADDRSQAIRLALIDFLKPNTAVSQPDTRRNPT